MFRIDEDYKVEVPSKILGQLKWLSGKHVFDGMNGVLKHAAAHEAVLKGKVYFADEFLYSEEDTKNDQFMDSNAQKLQNRFASLSPNNTIILCGM